MEVVLIVVICVVGVLIAGGGVTAYGRNAEEVTPERGDKVMREPPGFKKPPGGDGGLL